MANYDGSPSITVASAIHKIQARLIEAPSTPLDLLIAASTLLSRPDYDDVVAERVISDLCGCPLCPKPRPPPADLQRKGKYRISRSEKKVYDLQESYSYCCEECLIRSRALKGGMAEGRRSDLDVGKAKLEGLLRLFGLLSGDEEGEEVREAERLGNLKLEIREKESSGVGDVKLDEWIGPSNAIEGYIPQLDRVAGSSFAFNSEALQGIDGANGIAVNISTATVEDKICRDQSEEPSAVTNDVKVISKKLEDTVITDKEKTYKRLPTLSKPKSQRDAASNYAIEVEYADVGFSRSIMFDNEFVSTLPKTCAVSTEEASELIAKQLEDVVIAEKAARKVKESKSPRFKPNIKPSGKKSGKVEFGSDIIIRDPGIAAASKTSFVLSPDDTKNSTQKSGAEVHANNKTNATCYDETAHILSSERVSTESKEDLLETGLKSCLKTTESKVVNRSVKWADDKDQITFTNDKGALEVAQGEDFDDSFRLTSAEACAAALSQAAEAVASGEVEAGDAVSDAGIVILSQPQYQKDGDSEADDEAFAFDQGVLKWPKKTVLLDHDMFDVEDSWHDTPPEGFSLTLSSFATMWMALFGWITCSSLAYIYGRDGSSHEDFLFVNGREYPRKIFIRDGKSSEIRLTLDGFVCRTLPGLAMDLRLSTPVSTLEKYVERLLNTMSFVDALPSFRVKQWQVIVLLFLEALSVHRLPSLAPQMTSRRVLLHKVLRAAQVSGEEYETIRDLIMPLGRLPEFSMQRGA